MPMTFPVNMRSSLTTFPSGVHFTKVSQLYETGDPRAEAARDNKSASDLPLCPIPDRFSSFTKVGSAVIQAPEYIPDWADYMT